MQELKLCSECNIKMNVHIYFYSFTVKDANSVYIAYSSKCEECKDKKTKETKLRKTTDEEYKE